jgi:hypothetical protein
MVVTYRSRTLLQAAIGLVGLAGLALIAFFGVHRAKQIEEREEKQRKQLLQFEPNKVTRLMVKNGALRAVAERMPSEDQGLAAWRLTEPLPADGDNISINALLGALERLESTQTISGQDALDSKRYGLDAPRGALQMQLQDGTSIGLLLGKRSSYNNDLYVQKEGGNEVQVVAGSQESALLKKPFDLRRKELMRFDTTRVHSFTLTQGKENIELEKTGNQWRLVKPIADLADSSEVLRLLDTARTLRANEFLDAAIDSEKAYGLDPPAVALKVFLDPDQTSQALVLGKGALESNKTKYYARSREPASSLAEVPEYQLKNLQKTAFDLQERMLLRFEPEAVYQIKLASDVELVVLEKKVEEKPGEQEGPPIKEESWSLISPKTSPANKMKVSQLLSNLSQLKAMQFDAERERADLSRYGLSRPLRTITLLGKEGQELGSLHVGAKAERSEGRTFVVGANRPYVCQVETKQLDSILVGSKDLEENPVSPPTSNSKPAQ